VEGSRVFGGDFWLRTSPKRVRIANFHSLKLVSVASSNDRSSSVSSVPENALEWMVRMDSAHVATSTVSSLLWLLDLDLCRMIPLQQRGLKSSLVQKTWLTFVDDVEMFVSIRNWIDSGAIALENHFGVR